MTSIRILAVTGVVVAMIGALGAFLPLGALVVRSAIWESLNPGPIDWESKSAWKKCESAIAGRLAWPEEHEARCRALSMCENEAPLSKEQGDALAAEARQGQPCADF